MCLLYVSILLYTIPLNLCYKNMFTRCQKVAEAKKNNKTKLFCNFRRLMWYMMVYKKEFVYETETLHKISF